MCSFHFFLWKSRSH